MKQKGTLTHWISVLLLIFWVGFFALSFFVSIYTGTVMRRQASEAYADLLGVCLEKLDSNVEGIDRFMSQFPSSSYSVSTLTRTQDKTEHYLAKQDVMRQLRNTAFIYNTFNGIFLYSQGALEDTFLCQLRDGATLFQQENIRKIITEDSQIRERDGWHIVSCQEQVYLLKTLRSGDTCCGVWLDPQAAIEPLSQLQVGEGGAILMLDLDGKVLGKSVFTGQDHFSPANNGKLIRLEGKKYLQIGRSADNLPAALVALIPEAEFARDVRITQAVIILVLSVALLLFPTLWYLMNQQVSRPVKALTETMSRIGQGDLTATAATGNRFSEFQTIAESLNRMTHQIRKLQQDVYERQLREQRTRLQYLGMQIRPHFFLNSLNIIYSFSLTGRNDLIEQLTLCLSQYFRYIFQCESAFVPLRKELEHIENYMEIQRLRDHGFVSYETDIDDVLLDTLIPPLTIQPFVENCIKYGCTGEENRLFLTVECRQVHGQQKLFIRIQDSGPGYPENVLRCFAGDLPMGEDSTRRIGLLNVKQRLQLTYGNDAEICLHNAPEGGACSELYFPLKWQEEGGAEA